MEHHQQVSISALSHGNACFCFEAVSPVFYTELSHYSSTFLVAQWTQCGIWEWVKAGIPSYLMVQVMAIVSQTHIQ